jgi:hypothetical protein
MPCVHSCLPALLGTALSKVPCTMHYALMQAELKMSGITNIGMHNLSPGMVTTDLLMSGNLHQSSNISYLEKLTSCHCLYAGCMQGCPAWELF